MIKKTLIILGGVASLMLANSAAIAQNYGNRAYCDDYARQAAHRGRRCHGWCSRSRGITGPF